MSDHDEFITQTQQGRNAGVLHSWLPRWVWNTAANFQIIRREFLQEEHSEYALFRHKDKHKGPAMIVGAGPSFDQAAPFLKKWKGVLFAPESMAHTCVYHDRVPEYIGLYDAHPAAWDNFFEGIDWSRSTMVTHPAVSEKAMDLYPGPKLYYTMMHIAQPDYTVFHPNMAIQEMYKVVKDQMFGADFFETINPILYPYIGTSILNAGCVVNNMVQVANYMGFDPIVLAGVDFGYANGMDRCTGWHKKNDEWIKKPNMAIKDMGRAIKTSENGIQTTEEQVEYKIAMMAIYGVDKPNLVDCSAGIITELPKADIEDMIKKRARGFPRFSREKIERISKEYLESKDAMSEQHRANLRLTETEKDVG